MPRPCTQRGGKPSAEIRGDTPTEDPPEDRNRPILEYLKETFNNGTFHNSTDYRHWLDANEVPNIFGNTP